MAAAPTAPSNQFATAVEGFRSTAKWLISAFAALGGVLIAGVQITGLGGLSGHRLHMAILGLALGLIGVAIAIAATTRVLTPEAAVPEQLVTRRFTPLRTYVGRYPATLLHHQAPNTPALVAALDAAIVLEQAKYAHHVSLQADDAEYGKAETEYTDASAARRSLSATVSDLQELGLLLVVRRRFLQAVCVIFFAALVAAAGVALFAYWANPPKAAPVKAQAAAIQRQAVRVALTPAGRAVLQPAVGAHCQLSKLRALILAGTTKRPQIVTLPAKHCRSLQLTLSPMLGETYN